MLLLSASPAGAGETPAPITAEQAFAEMRAAWNRGDLEAALDGYWNSPDLVWVSRSGVSRGFAQFAEGMRADFGDAPETMGEFTAEILDSRQIGDYGAITVARWSIDRDGEQIMGGVSTMLWRRIEGEWRIVLEHAS
ncbi:MAG: DUF4440 domain-containing protein [Parasphingopyxis sp.]|nr:nuclear transport factor 2 family protein [Sphingomonadales bacterium]